MYISNQVGQLCRLILNVSGLLLLLASQEGEEGVGGFSILSL